jgi:uncharacterized membrane protein
MGFTDVLILVIRWIHAIAAVAWVGGGIFYLVVLRPALRASNDDGESALRRLGEQFRHLVNTAIAVLLVTGAVMTLSRLTSGYVGLPYIVVLVIKIVMALYMFYLVRFLRSRTYPAEVMPQNKRLHRLTSVFTGATAVLILGVIVFLLADILRALIEKGIEG